MDDNCRNIDQSLLQAYLDTVYKVENPPISLRIGQPNAELKALLQRYGVQHWAFITAWNPKSQMLTSKENERRQQKLVKLLEKAGYTYFRGYGVGADASWAPEESVLILDIPRAAALALGRHGQQHAIVVGDDTHYTPALLFC
ncbi:MAG TPA: DUF3293 domain-containing protein [Saprospiraceae bacterium]|nr:DUF3293 domain-containing protein [Saprospiraceae bacterium]HMP26185.1 DUF3293 domain-containing protein [Saprospiraceae bacterium]